MTAPLRVPRQMTAEEFDAARSVGTTEAGRVLGCHPDTVRKLVADAVRGGAAVNAPVHARMRRAYYRSGAPDTPEASEAMRRVHELEAQSVLLRVRAFDVIREHGRTSDSLRALAAVLCLPCHATGHTYEPVGDDVEASTCGECNGAGVRA